VSEANGTSGELALPELAPSEARSVACAGPILASAVRCCCSSENIPLSDRESEADRWETRRRSASKSERGTA